MHALCYSADVISSYLEIGIGLQQISLFLVNVDLEWNDFWPSSCCTALLVYMRLSFFIWIRDGTCFGEARLQYWALGQMEGKSEGRERKEVISKGTGKVSECDALHFTVHDERIDVFEYFADRIFLCHVRRVRLRLNIRRSAHLRHKRAEEADCC